MHTTHVVKQIPATREAVSGYGSVTSLEQAKVRVVSMAVESVGFPFVTEETRIGGELQLGIHAGGHLAPVGLQVRVQVFAAESH